MKNFVVGGLGAIVFLAVVAIGYVAFGFAALGADAKPFAWEAEIMDSAVHASVRRRAPNVQNPVVPTDETLVAGGKLFLGDCVGCHGAPGKPASTFGVTFFPPAPQFFLTGTQYSEAQVFWIAKHGIRRTGMFPEGPYYTDPELWTLAAFVARSMNLSPNVIKGLQQSSK
jgi:mono/diheme cytochrome c family protein